MSLIIITKELFSTGFLKDKAIVLDPSEIQKCISELQNYRKSYTSIIIYDKTYNKNQAGGEVLPVNDHINKTGHNPLIGNQAKLNIDFTDLTHIYNTHPNGVITECVGEKFNNKTKSNKSAYFCNISILARALGFSEISGFLVNAL